MYTLTNTTTIKRDSDGAMIPADPANRDYQDYLVWVAGGGVPTPVPGPTAMEQQQVLMQAVQDYMDAAAKAKGYDSILSACSYAGAPNPFQAEGQSFLAWRAACWAYCYQVQAAVAAGTQPMPRKEQLITGLPTRI